MSRADGAAAVVAPTRNPGWPLAPVPAPNGSKPRLVLLGTGQVGQAVLERLAGFRPEHQPVLVAVANSRAGVALPVGLAPDCALARMSSHGRDDWQALLSGDAGPAPIVVDATASDAVADRHAGWLAAGIDVVSANKLGPGGPLQRAEAIAAAAAHSGACYGIAATVGAGLPMLDSIARLRRGGDAIVRVAGVLSGTLAWLLDRYDGSEPFSGLVRQAQLLGYTEPDPRQDLSGLDVVRKLLILARACGRRLELDQVQWRPLLAPAAADDPDLLDAVMAGHLACARERGAVLRHVARLDRHGRAWVGLEALAPSHPLAGAGSDNRLLVASSRYLRQPLLIQGPGAGAEVTAAALLDQVLAIAAGPRRQC